MSLFSGHGDAAGKVSLSLFSGGGARMGRMSQRVDNAVFGGDAGASGALRLLFWLRWGAVAAQSVVITFVDRILASPVPLKPLVLTISALALWNVLNYRAVHAKRLVQYGEVALNLVVDVVAFTTILYFTGGPTNPFVSIYLVPISLAAASLPALYAWLIGAICGVGYSLLWWRHVALPSVDSRFGADFDLHVAGMWVNFLIAAALIVFFVGRMANLVRRRDQELAAMRETALRDQQIVELGTLAAGTATDPAQREYLRVMMEEIATINERLNRIVGRVGAERSEGVQHIGLRAF